MSTLTAVAALITSAPTYVGYPATGARLPYVAIRPLIIDGLDRAVNGSAFGWDTQFSVYCAGASVEASYNLALEVIAQVDGKPLEGTTLSTSVGYIGAQVEGHYETQVTVQLTQGGI